MKLPITLRFPVVFLGIAPLFISLVFISVLISSENSVIQSSRESMAWHETCLAKQKRIQELKDQITFLEVDEMFHLKTSDEVAAGIMKLKLEIATIQQK